MKSSPFLHSKGLDVNLMKSEATFSTDFVLSGSNCIELLGCLGLSMSRRHNSEVTAAVCSVSLQQSATMGGRGNTSPLEMKDELWKCTCFYGAGNVSCSRFFGAC